MARSECPAWRISNGLGAETRAAEAAPTHVGNHENQSMRSLLALLLCAMAGAAAGGELDAGGAGGGGAGGAPAGPVLITYCTS